MKKNIIIWGSSFLAKSTIDIIEREKKYNITCLYNPTLNKQSKVYNYKVFGKSNNFAEIIKQKNIEGVIVSIGDNWIRKKESDFIKSNFPDLIFINAIHPSVHIGKNVKIGTGTIIMPKVIIGSNTKIGKNCFLGTNSILEHDCVLKDFSSTHTGVIVGGCTKIGECSNLALGVICFDRIDIGDHTVIGAGSLVNKNIPDQVIAYGFPVKVVRKRKIGEKYIERVPKLIVD